jgi:hypothetical protein
MTDAAAIDGVTGPGRRTQLISGDVTEVGFKLKKKIIEITNKDGTVGQYDMAVVGSVQVSSDGQDFTLVVLAKEDADARAAKDANSGKIGAEPNAGAEVQSQSGTKPSVKSDVSTSDKG